MVSIPVTRLRAGMTLAFDNPRQNVIVDSVEDTREGGVRVRTGYTAGDNSITFFYEADEYVSVLG